MASYINTNFASLQAQNNLANSQNSLQTSIQRLSSGLRINSAADDAAGLAISDRMTSQINGLNQAAQNANDGISLAQTADGALSSVSSDLQRIRQLAVESANSTNSSSDRQSLNQESTQLLSEIQRIASTTQFNGLNLLDGSFSGQQFQVGANANQTINVNLAGALTTSLGSYGGVGANVSNTAFSATNQISVNGTNIGASIGTDPTHGLTDGSAAAKAAAINAQSATTGVTATASTTYTGGAISTTATSLNAGDVTINGVALGAVTGSTNVVTQGQNFAAAVNAISATTGVTASADASTGKLTLSATDGRDISVVDSTATPSGANIAAYGFTANGTAGTTNGITYSANGFYATGKITLSSPSAIALGNATGTTGLADAGLAAAGTDATTSNGAGGAASTETALSTAFSGAAFNGYSASLQSLSTVDLTTVNGANSALSIIDGAISQVDSQRAVLGATSNRFQATVSNLQQTSANLSSSRSRIEDTDYAAETANLSQAQILQQAGTAMLTQANSLPNSVLTLLKG